MKRTIIALTVGLCLGFAGANYKFDAQKIYETGCQDGYKLQRQSTIFVATTNYQRGWEDCYQIFLKKRVKKTRSTTIASK